MLLNHISINTVFSFYNLEILMNHKHNTSLTKNELKNIIAEKDREIKKLEAVIKKLEVRIAINRCTTGSNY